MSELDQIEQQAQVLAKEVYWKLLRGIANERDQLRSEVTRLQDRVEELEVDLLMYEQGATSCEY